MPNYCNCSLIIDNITTEESKAVVEAAEGKGLLETFIPQPEEESDWYTWRMENWGAKWDLEDVTSYAEDTTCALWFWTPWNPPVNGVAAISMLFPDANFTLFYYESGCDFAGEATFHNGLKEEIDIVYSEAKEDWLQTDHPELYKKYKEDDEEAWRAAEDIWAEIEVDVLREYIEKAKAQSKAQS